MTKSKGIDLFTMRLQFICVFTSRFKQNIESENTFNFKGFKKYC